MKNLIKSSLVLAIAAFAFSSCNCFKQMAKNRDDVKVTVVPEVLALNNGTVAADIQVSFLLNISHKQAIVKVTPVIVFEGGEVAGTPKFYQGTKVDENYTVVDNINGGKFVQHVEFPYDPRMDQCELQLRAEIKCPKGGCKEFTLVNLNNGALPTKEQSRDFGRQRRGCQSRCCQRVRRNGRLWSEHPPERSQIRRTDGADG